MPVRTTGGDGPEEESNLRTLANGHGVTGTEATTPSDALSDGHKNKKESREGDLDDAAPRGGQDTSTSTSSTQQEKDIRAAATVAGAVAVAGVAATATGTQRERDRAADGETEDPETEPEPDSAAGTPYAAPTRWSKIKGYSTFRRSWEIWTFAASFFFRYWLVGRKFTYGKAGMTPERVSSRKRELAKWLVEGLVRLGPTFIKIGQQFSTRVDVLSKEFIEELERLQDRVPPFPTETATRIVERSLGRSVEEVFEEFEPTPIAAASLGQVHLARLRGTDGEPGQKVVVKVQRPGLKELFDIDLKNVRALAEWFQRVDPKTDGTARCVTGSGRCRPLSDAV